MKGVELSKVCLRGFRVSPVSLTPSIRFLYFLPTRNLSSDNKTTKEDRVRRFFHPQVQSLFSKMTNMDLKQVFRTRKLGQKLREPRLKFMTADQLEETFQETQTEAKRLLQMPPVLPPRKPTDKILSFDPQIQGFDNSTFLFTDISLNIKDHDRIIVARDPDGTLREATWEERYKMNNTYFPIPGRKFETPKMLSDSTILKEVLDRASPEDNTYEFVLDRACLQFEPDDPLYISVVETAYDAIDQMRHYDYIWSTRHYGPFVFYLVRTRKMDNLLIHNLQKERIENGTSPMLALFHLIFPESKSKSGDENMNASEIIRRYIEFDAVQRSELELANNAYEEIVKNRQDIVDGLQKAHGF